MSEDLFQDAKDKIKAKIAAAGKTTGTDEIVCIVDRSGSMETIRVEAAGGLNAFIKEQSEVGKANLTIVEFDNSVDTVGDKIPITEANEYDLKPRGMKALLDVIDVFIGDKEQYTPADGKSPVVMVHDRGETHRH